MTRPPYSSSISRPTRLATVDVLEGFEEALAAALGVGTVPDERKRTVRPQTLSAFFVTNPRIDPVERRGRDDEVEGLLLQRPLLEGADEHSRIRVVGQLRPGHGGKVRAELYAQEAVAPPCEGQRRLASSAADLERPGPWSRARQQRQVVEEPIRVAGTHLVVEGSHAVEGAAQPPRVFLRAQRCSFREVYG